MVDMDKGMVLVHPDDADALLDLIRQANFVPVRGSKANGVVGNWYDIELPSLPRAAQFTVYLDPFVERGTYWTNLQAVMEKRAHEEAELFDSLRQIFEHVIASQ